MEPKEVAARRAVKYVENGMTIGLGSGTTATFAIRAMAERIASEGLSIRGVPTSSASQLLASSLGIPIVDLLPDMPIDLTIDGADEIDSCFDLIKGGGGALVREKLVAAASRQLFIICDESKVKSRLGAFPLPVAVIPFGWQTTGKRLEKLGCPLSLRTTGPEQFPYVTDDGLYILDMHFGVIQEPPAVEEAIKRTLGVVEVGLFIGLTSRAIIASSDGSVEERGP